MSNNFHTGGTGGVSPRYADFQGLHMSKNTALDSVKELNDIKLRYIEKKRH